MGLKVSDPRGRGKMHRLFKRKEDPWAPGTLFTILAFPMMMGLILASAAYGWEEMDRGLSLGEFEPKKKSELCNDKVTILRIDPEFYSFRLLCASEHGRRPRALREWAQEFGLQAAINASMYQAQDFLRSTGYMKNHKHLNNPHINGSFGSLMLFNPIDPSLRQVQIIDRRLQEDWKELADRYHCAVQNYRMISKGVKRGWPQQETASSIGAVGLDRDHHVLFILSRSPFSVHDFIRILLDLPIGLEDAMYVEGGPQAALHLRTRKGERTWIGVCSEDRGGGPDGFSWEIPNAIGIVRKGE